tara:strand:+ start:380 stop:574 length:195 start_codon:yes stop_codon:yes gene_type:complete
MEIFWIIFFCLLLILPLYWEPSRKAIGLLNIILGTIISLTGIGILLGIPMLIFGGICFFYKKSK